MDHGTYKPLLKKSIAPQSTIYLVKEVGYKGNRVFTSMSKNVSTFSTSSKSVAMQTALSKMKKNIDLFLLKYKMYYF